MEKISKTAVFYPYLRNTLKYLPQWADRLHFLHSALVKKGYRVFFPAGFELDFGVTYDGAVEFTPEIAIFNHTVLPAVMPPPPADFVWFFKPTAFDRVHTTLDPLGYGSYSTLSYHKPDFETIDMNIVDLFLSTKVADWIVNNSNKHQYPVQDEPLPFDDYHLIIGQYPVAGEITGDDFGNFFSRVKHVTEELLRVSKRPIVIKTHPFTDAALQNRYNTLTSDRVAVYHGATAVNPFVRNAHTVLTANSGSGLEALMYGKPIISWGYPEFHWATYQLHHLCDMYNAINVQQWFNTETSYRFLYWYANCYCFYDSDSAARRVNELLLKEN